MTTDQLHQLIKEGETLNVEFKGEERAPLPDRDFLEAIVCLANRPGREPAWLLLGVEDDGRVTGLHPSTAATRRDVLQTQALIAGRTRPSLMCRAEVVSLAGKDVLVIEVPGSAAPVGTSDGKYLRRAIGGRGKPECLPYHFHEMQSRQADRQLLDPSALPVTGLRWEDLDPLEFERFRRCVRESRGRGDASLLELPDLELAKALGAVEADHSVQAVRLLGLLLFGREAALRGYLSAHEVAFQSLKGAEVETNEFFRWPLLRALEELHGRLMARNQETEIQVGMLRVGVPEYSARALREALANAIIHRDYRQLGAVHVQRHEDRIEISNPGGFPEGVTLQNLLVAPPRPRNPLLADAMKRAGMVERTGRGVDTIFEEQLRNGRPAPNYDRSTGSSVVVVIPGGEANLDFVRFVAYEGQNGPPLRLDALLVMNHLWRERRIFTAEAAHLIQKPETEAREVLSKLVERGLAEARGSGKGRDYHLSASVYRQAGDKAGYIRQRGFEPLQQEQMILQYLEKHGRITRGEAATLCRVNPNQAYRLLHRMVITNQLTQHGTRKAAWYARRA
jgi:ATP-dependent DNA helicase RecG